MHDQPLFKDIGSIGPFTEEGLDSSIRRVQQLLRRRAVGELDIDKAIDCALSYDFSEDHKAVSVVTLRGEYILLTERGAFVDVAFAPPLTVSHRRGAASARRETVAAEYCLRLLIPIKRQDEMIGDLLERYEEECLPTFGKWPARAWLVRQSASLIWAGCRLRKLSLIAGVLQLIHRLMSSG